MVAGELFIFAKVEDGFDLESRPEQGCVDAYVEVNMERL